jgi:hypothetical protein
MAKTGTIKIYTVDKLHVQYMIPKTVYDRFAQSDNDTFEFNVDGNDSSYPDIKLLRNRKDKFRFIISIRTPDYDKVAYFDFAEFVIKPESRKSEVERTAIGQKIDNSGTCYINVKNQALYEPLSTTYIPKDFIHQRGFRVKTKIDPKHMNQYVKSLPARPVKSWDKNSTNSIFALNYISEAIGISFVQVVNFEISFDGNMNYGKKILDKIREEKFIPVIHRDKDKGKINKDEKSNKEEYSDINSDKRLKGITVMYSTTRKKLVDMSLYVSIKNKDLQLKSYNKTKEIGIKDFEKQYILDKIGKDCDIFRLEITVKPAILKGIIQKYYGYKGLTKDEGFNESNFDFLFALTDETELERIFKDLLEKIIYFYPTNDPDTKISILDL